MYAITSICIECCIGNNIYFGGIAVNRISGYAVRRSNYPVIANDRSTAKLSASWFVVNAKNERNLPRSVLNVSRLASYQTRVENRTKINLRGCYIRRLHAADNRLQ